MHFRKWAKIYFYYLRIRDIFSKSTFIMILLTANNFLIQCKYITFSTVEYLCRVYTEILITFAYSYIRWHRQLYHFALRFVWETKKKSFVSPRNRQRKTKSFFLTKMTRKYSWTKLRSHYFFCLLPFNLIFFLLFLFYTSYISDTQISNI